MEEFTKFTQNWPLLANGLPHKWIVDYAPYSNYGTFELSNEDWEKRDYIVNFKGNSELTTEIDHQNALEKAIGDISTLVTNTFGEDASSLTFVCIPASNLAKTARRFEQFSLMVCQNTKMRNAYNAIKWNEDGTDFSIDEAAIKGKDILLFDDIIASGGSICRFSDKIKSIGGNVVAAIALGKKS